MSQHAKIGLVGVLALIVLIVALWGNGDEADRSTGPDGQTAQMTGSDEDMLSGSVGNDLVINEQGEIPAGGDRPVLEAPARSQADAGVEGGPEFAEGETVVHSRDPEVREQPVVRERLSERTVLTSSRISSSDPPSGGKRYKVGSNDSYYSLAKRFYGNGNMWRKIYEANKERHPDPDILPLGSTIVIPAAGGGGGATIPGGSRASPSSAAVASARRSSGSARSYTVQHGDTLSSIAQELLGSRDKWRSIYVANRDQLSHPDALRTGITLVIPR